MSRAKRSVFKATKTGIDLYHVSYYVRWADMLPGHSVYLKTTAAAAQVQRALRPVEQELNIVLQAQARCEFGFYGVRVWRLA